jgi:hypothetical protein
MKAEVSRAVVSGPEASMARLAAIAGDLKATGAIAELTFTPGGDAISVDVTLA